MPTDRLETLDEEACVHNQDTGEIYEVLEIDVVFDDDGIPSGSVVFETVASNQDEAGGSSGESEFSRDAKTVDSELHDQTLRVIDPDVISNAEEILLEFASAEIGTYETKLGTDHPYNGISHADTIRDIKAAAYISREA